MGAKKTPRSRLQRVAKIAPTKSSEARLSLGRARDDGQARFPVAPAKAALPEGYVSAFGEIRARIESARLKAVVDANATMIDLYWRIGGVILTRQEAEGWGARVIDRLSQDLRTAFPEMSGLSARNLKYMRAFAAAWPEPAIVQRTLHKLPWGVNVELLDRLKQPETRLWYAERAFEHGWSRNILAMHIERREHERQGKAQNNFARALPPSESDMAAATVQNKMHWATHGHTAAEIVHERADATKPLMGLQTTRPGGIVRKEDAAVAKNYLTEHELQVLNRIVALYIEYAELQALERKPMSMQDWVTKLDDFLKASGRKVLANGSETKRERPHDRIFY